MDRFLLHNHDKDWAVGVKSVHCTVHKAESISTISLNLSEQKGSLWLHVRFAALAVDLCYLQILVVALMALRFDFTNHR